MDLRCDGCTLMGSTLKWLINWSKVIILKASSLPLPRRVPDVTFAAAGF